MNGLKRIYAPQPPPKFPLLMADFLRRTAEIENPRKAHVAHEATSK
jgi:hypothetical protein